MKNQWQILAGLLERDGLLRRWGTWMDLFELYSCGMAGVVLQVRAIMGFLALWPTSIYNCVEVGTFWVHEDWRGRKINGHSICYHLFHERCEIIARKKLHAFMISPNDKITELALQFKWIEEKDFTVVNRIRKIDNQHKRRLFYADMESKNLVHKIFTE